MAVAVSAEPFAFSPPLLSRNLWIPFRREKVSKAQFFFPKRKRAFSSTTAQKGEGARARNAVEDLNIQVIRGYSWAATESPKKTRSVSL
jgi:hypothetical protein